MISARYTIAAWNPSVSPVPDVVFGEAKGETGTLVLFPSVFSGAE